MTANVVEKETKAVPWWLILIEGVALVVLGLLWLSNPKATTLVVMQLVGLYWLIAGIFKLISIFLDHSMWGWKLFAGILGIIAGILVLQNPLWSSVIVGATLIIVLGIQGLIYGGIGIWQAFKGAGWGTGILGVISVIFGIILLTTIKASPFALPWVLGIFSLISGIAAIVIAFRQRSQ